LSGEVYLYSLLFSYQLPGTKVEANLFESLGESLCPDLSSMAERAKKKTCEPQDPTSLSKSE